MTGKRWVLTPDIRCQCPVAWYSWGLRVEHTRDCVIWQWQHPVQTWLRKTIRSVNRKSS